MTIMQKLKKQINSFIAIFIFLICMPNAMAYMSYTLSIDNLSNTSYVLQEVPNGVLCVSSPYPRGTIEPHTKKDFILTPCGESLFVETVAKYHFYLKSPSQDQAFFNWDGTAPAAMNTNLDGGWTSTLTKVTSSVGVDLSRFNIEKNGTKMLITIS